MDIDTSFEIDTNVQSSILASLGHHMQAASKRAALQLEAVYTSRHLGNWFNAMDRDFLSVRMRHFDALNILGYDSEVLRQKIDDIEVETTNALMQSVKDHCVSRGIELFP